VRSRNVSSASLRRRRAARLALFKPPTTRFRRRDEFAHGVHEPSAIEPGPNAIVIALKPKPAKVILALLGFDEIDGEPKMPGRDAYALARNKLKFAWRPSESIGSGLVVRVERIGHCVSDPSLPTAVVPLQR
jgi:hypothetical protein